MSNPYEDHPGKGFSYVPGYNPPAGTQAEQEKRRLEEEARKREQDARDRMWQEQERQRERQQREQERQRQQREAEQKEHERKQLAKKQQSSRSKPKTSKPGKWSTGWAVLGFVIGIGWASNEVPEGDDAAMMIFIAGVAGAIVAGRFYKVLLAIAAILFIIYMATGGGG